MDAAISGISPPANEPSKVWPLSFKNPLIFFKPIDIVGRLLRHLTPKRLRMICSQFPELIILVRGVKFLNTFQCSFLYNLGQFPVVKSTEVIVFSTGYMETTDLNTFLYLILRPY